MKDSEGNVIGASKILHDISDILAARDALARESELFATTLRSIGDAVIVTDAQGRITFVNPEAERLTGWAQSDAAGQQLPDVFRIVNEGTRNRVENPVDKVIRSGGTVGLANHTLLIDRNGIERPIGDSAAPILPGRSPSALCLLCDITEESRLKSASGSERKTVLAISRRLRNPLAPIGIAWRSFKEPGLRSQFKQLCGIVDRQTKRLTRLLDDL